LDLEAGNTKEVLHNTSIKELCMPIPEPVVVEFEVWIGFAWFVAFLLLSMLPITFQQEREWSAPTIALPPIAIEIFSIFERIHTFKLGCYSENSSTAIAGQGLMRDALSGVAPLFAGQFF
jgi:hypothetical protein